MCSGNKKGEGFSKFFSVSCIGEVLCLYSHLGTIEILVFNYNKIYEEGIGPDETYYRN